MLRRDEGLTICIRKCVSYIIIISSILNFRLNPKYVHAMNNLGNILKERNELQEAEELLSLAVQIQYV